MVTAYPRMDEALRELRERAHVRALSRTRDGKRGLPRPLGLTRSGFTFVRMHSLYALHNLDTVYFGFLPWYELNLNEMCK
jgi:hypothetical protein